MRHNHRSFAWPLAAGVVLSACLTESPDDPPSQADNCRFSLEPSDTDAWSVDVGEAETRCLVTTQCATGTRLLRIQTTCNESGNPGTRHYSTDGRLIGFQEISDDDICDGQHTAFWGSSVPCDPPIAGPTSSAACGLADHSMANVLDTDAQDDLSKSHPKVVEGANTWARLQEAGESTCFGTTTCVLPNATTVRVALRRSPCELLVDLYDESGAWGGHVRNDPPSIRVRADLLGPLVPRDDPTDTDTDTDTVEMVPALVKCLGNLHNATEKPTLSAACGVVSSPRP